MNNINITYLTERDIINYSSGKIFHYIWNNIASNIFRRVGELKLSINENAE